MADRSILFSGPMIRALLAGTKTQTRRILKRELQTQFDKVGEAILRRHPNQKGIGWEVGDRLWIRETWQLHSRASDVCSVVYRASIDGGWMQAHEQFRDSLAGKMQPKPFQERWASPIHMPRWASRLTLVVTNVRVQRLREISEADARAEGHPITWDGKQYDPPPPDVDRWQGYGRASFSLLWSKLHGPGAVDLNPFVAAITFTTHRCNVDAMPEAPTRRAEPDGEAV